jgi:hypothetical protein
MVYTTYKTEIVPSRKISAGDAVRKRGWFLGLTTGKARAALGEKSTEPFPIVFGIKKGK